MPGVHSDVGGGYVENFISNIALLTMAKLLEKHAAVALDKGSVAEIERAIKRKVEGGQFHVNKEPAVRDRLSRIRLIESRDEIHPLHKYLIGRNVYFKDRSNVTTYEDRIGDVGGKDDSLTRMFEKWVHVPNKRRAKQ